MIAAENPANISTDLLPAPILQKNLKANGLLAHVDGEGKDSMYYDDNMDQKHKNYIVKTNDNKLYVQKSVDEYKKKNEELQQGVRELQQEVLTP